MANQNYKPGIGRLATDRYDFQDHVDGYNFRHKADNIDLNPTVSIDTGSGTVVATEVQAAIEALASNTTVPTVNPASTTELGVVRLNPSGDVGGSANLLRVVGIQGLPVQYTPIGSMSDGYLLAWDASANQWVPKTPSFIVGPATQASAGIVQLLGDIGGSYNNLTVEKLQTYNLNLSSPSSGNFIGWDDFQEEYINMDLPVATSSNPGLVQLADNNYSGNSGPDITGSYDALKVKGIQNFYVYPDAPSVGKVLTWDEGASGEGWMPKDLTITSENIPSADTSNKGGVILQGDIGGTWDNLKVQGFYNQPFTVSSWDLTGDYYIPYYFNDGDGYWKTGHIGDFVGGDLYSTDYNQQEVRGIYGNSIINYEGTAAEPSYGDILVYYDAEHASEIFEDSAGWYIVSSDSITFNPSGDLGGNFSSQKVIAITGATGATGYDSTKFVADVKSDYISSSSTGPFYISRKPTSTSTSKISIKGQDTTGNYSAGSVEIITGESTGSVSGYGGNIYLTASLGPSGSGNIIASTYDATVKSGYIAVSTGNSEEDDSGYINFTTGIAAGAEKSSGSIGLTTGDVLGSDSSAGNIDLTAGSATDGEGGAPGNINLTAGSAGFTNGGNVNIIGGSATGPSGTFGGSVYIRGGSTTGPSGTTGGFVFISTENSNQAGSIYLTGGNSSADGSYGGSIGIVGGNNSNEDGYGGVVFIKGGVNSGSEESLLNNGLVVLGSGDENYLLQVSGDHGGYVAICTSDSMFSSTESNPTANGSKVIYIHDAESAPAGATADAPTEGAVLYSKDQDLWVARGGTGGVTGDGYVNYYDPNYSIAAGPNPISRSFILNDYTKSRYYKFTNAVRVENGSTRSDLFEHATPDTSSIIYLKGNIIVTPANRDGTYSIYEFIISYSYDGDLQHVATANFININGGFTPSAPTYSETAVKIQSGYDATDDTDWVINIEVFTSDGV